MISVHLNSVKEAERKGDTCVADLFDLERVAFQLEWQCVSATAGIADNNRAIINAYIYRSLPSIPHEHIATLICKRLSGQMQTEIMGRSVSSTLSSNGRLDDFRPVPLCPEQSSQRTAKLFQRFLRGPHSH